jgi:hypothetical protein
MNNLVEAMHLATFVPTTSCILLSAFTVQQAAFAEQSIADAAVSGPAILIGIGIFCGIALLLAFAMCLAAWCERRRLILSLAVVDVAVGIISIVLGLVMISKYTPQEAIQLHCDEIYSVDQAWIRHYAGCTKYYECADAAFSFWAWETAAGDAGPASRCINYRCCGSLQLALTETTGLIAMLLVGQFVWCLASAAAALYTWWLLLFRSYDDRQSDENLAKYGACNGHGFKHPYSAAATAVMSFFAIIMLIVVLPIHIKTRPEYIKIGEEELRTGLLYPGASNSSSTRPVSYSEQFMLDHAAGAPVCNPPIDGSYRPLIVRASSFAAEFAWLSRRLSR